MESRLIHRGGVPLHGLWRPGTGDPLVVVPGVMADAQSFRPVADAFERPEPTLILDRRGRSLSGAPGPGYSLDTEVQDLLAWIDSLDTHLTLIGWSYGGTIALEAAARDSRVGAVVAYEPVLGPFGVEALPELRTADPDRRVEIVNLVVSKFPREHVDALRATPAWKELTRLAEPLVEELAAVNAFEPSHLWARVSAELILGEHNQAGAEPYGVAFERVLDRLPLATTTILKGQGHLAHADDPASLGRLIGQLVADDRRRPGQSGR